MRNFARLNNAANRIQAQHDYNALVFLAQQQGQSHLIPAVADDAGWRVIDRAAGKGAEALARAVPSTLPAILRIYPGMAEKLQPAEETS